MEVTDKSNGAERPALTQKAMAALLALSQHHGVHLVHEIVSGVVAAEIPEAKYESGGETAAAANSGKK